MGLNQELINTHAPQARCILPMKVWKLPENKEHMLPELCTNGKYFAQEKKDGYWYQYEKTANHAYLFSRTISKKTGILSNKIDNVPHIKDALAALPAGTILIGEIYYPHGTSKDVTTIMGCLAAEAVHRQLSDSGPIHYYIHDVIYYDGKDLQGKGAYMRYQVLERICKKYNLLRHDFIELADNITGDIIEATDVILANGGEGSVLKLKTAPYVADKKPAWSSIKIKKLDHLDVVCTGFIDATEYYTGKDISTWCYWQDGTRKFFVEDPNDAVMTNTMKPITKGHYHGWKTAISIGAYDGDQLIPLGTIASGLTDELREDFAQNPHKYLHKVCKVQCMEKDGVELTLRHAFFKGFRDDKSDRECTVQDIFS